MEERSRQELEDQVELLQQQLTSLTGSSQQIGVLVALRHGMTNRMATILSILVNRSPALVSRNTLHQLLFGHAEDGGPDPRIFNVYMTRLRKILKRVKAEGKIDTVWNAGFRASPDLVKWVHDLYDKQIPKEK